MIAVGIDVSKSKSTVAIINADGTKRVTPFEVKHNLPELNALIKYLNDLNENIVILMEHTGHYHYSRKPYNVAKMAGVNKFLRIYYARAMELEQ